MKTDKPKGSQTAKFRETARELGCDESEAAFNAALKAVADASHKADVPPKKPKEKKNG